MVKLLNVVRLLDIAFQEFARDDPPFEHPLEQTKEALTGEGSLPELFREPRERPEALKFEDDFAADFAKSHPFVPFTASLPRRDLVGEINREGRKEEAAMRAENPDSTIWGARDMAEASLAEFRSWTRNGIFDSSRINTRPVDSHR